MTLGGTPSLLAWFVNALLAVVLTLVGFNANREYSRNDDQEKRIQVLERAMVKIDYISDTMNKIEKKVDHLADRKQ